MIKLCDACEAQITKGPDDPAHLGLKFVFNLHKLWRDDLL